MKHNEGGVNVSWGMEILTEEVIAKPPAHLVGTRVSTGFCNFLRRKRNGDGGSGGDEGLCERAADIFTKRGRIAPEMKSAPGSGT